MRALFIALALNAFAISDGNGRAYSEVQSTTRSVAALTVADGIPLAGLRAVTVTISADSGATLSGAGTVDAYYYDPEIGRYASDTALTFTVAAGASGKRDWTLGTVIVDNPRGRLMYACNGVTVSAGSCTVHMDGVGVNDQGSY